MKRLLYLLSVLSTLSYFSIIIGNAHAKLDQLLVILMFVVLVIYVLFVGGKFYIDAAGYFLILLCLVSLYSSWYNAPDRRYSIVQTLNLFSVSLCYFILPNVLKAREDLEKFIKVHLRVSKVCLILATILFVISFLRNVGMFGVNLYVNDFSPFGVYFTMLEPNIFGSFMLIIFCISFALYMSSSVVPGMSKTELRSILSWSVIGILLSFTRAVWLGALFGVAFYYVFNSKNAVKSMQQIAYFSISIIVLYFLASEVLHITILTYKVNNFLTASAGTGKGRLVLWETALDNWQSQGHVYFGTGTYSYATFFNTEDYHQRNNAWIGNMYLTFLHDTGIVGLLFFLIFYTRLAFITLKNKMYRRLDRFTYIKDLNVGLFIALMGIGIAFFFTMALAFVYPWILFGLISAFNRINKRELKEKKTMPQ